MCALDAEYDLIIIGAGPAGLAAGIYGGRALLKTLILEKGAIGGRAYTTREIANYPGVGRISGPELTKAMAEHAARFGAEIVKEDVKAPFLKGYQGCQDEAAGIYREGRYYRDRDLGACSGDTGRTGINRSGRGILRDVRRGIFQRQTRGRCGKRRPGD